MHLTVDEFDEMVERGAFDHFTGKIELIRGELREMNPAGPLHDGLITCLTNWSALAAAKASYLVTAQTALNLAQLESRPEPDLIRPPTIDCVIRPPRTSCWRSKWPTAAYRAI